jgi:hypothetical protein
VKFVTVAMIFMASAGCSKPAAPVSIHDQRQAEVDKVADACGLPRSALRLVGDDQLHMQPLPDTKYERVDCALVKLKKMPDLKLGFVGNEYYPNDSGPTN